MPSLPNHERRITALETRVREVETSHGETLYKMNRRLAKHELFFRVLLEHFHLREPTEKDVDELLDQE